MSYDVTGTLSSNMSITANAANLGHFIISAFQSTNLAGSGTLINIRFSVLGSSGQFSPLQFEDYTDPSNIFHPGFQFNEGVPAAALTNGGVSIFAANIAGTVTYGNALGTPSPRFVSNVTISGAGSPAVMTTTGGPGSGEGQYTLSGFGAGPYTVTPTKIGGTNGAINSFDAAKIAQHVAGLNFLTGNALVVADVSNNGTVSSFDAGEIANFVVAGSPSGMTGVWKFSPMNRFYASVNTNLSGQDFEGLLYGEVSGNWLNSGARPLENGFATGEGESQGDINVNVPQLVSPSGGEISIPINVTGIKDKGIISYEFDLRYDPLVIQPQGKVVDVTETVSRGLSGVANANETGLLRVAVYGSLPIDADGILLNLHFKAVGPLGSASPLKWERLVFNEGGSENIVTDGQIEVADVAASEASLFLATHVWAASSYRQDFKPSDGREAITKRFEVVCPG